MPTTGQAVKMPTSPTTTLPDDLDARIAQAVDAAVARRVLEDQVALARAARTSA